MFNNNSQNFPVIVGGLNIDFNKDGSFSIKGTPANTWNKKRNTGNIYNIEAGTYTVYLKVVGNCPNARFTITLEDKDMKTIVSGIVAASDSSLIKVATFDYDGTSEIAYTSIVLESFKTDSSYDCTFYPMLMKGIYTADVAYEQYGASPSPIFSSEIGTVGSNENILNYNNLTTAAQNAGYVIDESGNVYHQEQVGDTRSWNYSNSNYMLELNKGSYMLSMYFSKQTSNNNAQIVIYKEDNKSIKITKLNNINSIKIAFDIQESQKIGLMIKTFEGIYKIKLEKGSEATPWSPYRNG